MIQLHRPSALGLVFIAGLAPAAFGQTTDWTSASGGQWFEPLNWLGNTVPHANGRSARFPAALPLSGPVEIGSNVSIESLLVETPSATLRLSSGRSLTLNNAASTNNGLVDINPTSGAGNTSLTLPVGVAVSGTGTILLNAPAGGPLAASSIGGVGSLTNNAGHTIAGAGQIIVVTTNNGLIDASLAGRRLQINRNVSQSASGVLRASAGTLALTGSGAVFSGGTVESQGAGRVEITVTPTLDALTFGGNVDVRGSLRVGATGFVNNATITVNPDNSPGTFEIESVGSISPVISGTGTIVLNGANPATAVLAGPSFGRTFFLTLGPGQTVRGMGRLILNIINQGTIRADNPAGVLDLNGDITQQGAGRILAENGAIITLRGGSVTGGTLSTSLTSRVDVTTASSLAGVVSDATIHVLTSIVLTANDTVNNGLMVVNPTSGASAASLRLEAPTSLTGSGVVRLGGTFAAPSRATIIGSPTSAPATLGPGLAITGSGRFNGQIVVQGTLAPGESFASMMPPVIGLFEGQSAASTLAPTAKVILDAAGSNPGEFDQLRFNSGLNLAGSLVFNLVPGYAPAGPCTEFAVVTGGANNILGRFDQVQLPADPPGAVWRVAYEGNAVFVRLTCPADFDASCFVDSDDFAAFNNAFVLGCTDFGQDPFGPNPACQASADFDQSGFVDADDFAAFVDAFLQPCS
jgi:hypothetical protein